MADDDEIDPAEVRRLFDEWWARISQPKPTILHVQAFGPGGSRAVIRYFDSIHSGWTFEMSPIDLVLMLQREGFEFA